MAGYVGTKRFENATLVREGAQGPTYRALDITTGNPVAIKVFNPRDPEKPYKRVYVDGECYGYMGPKYEAKILEDLTGIPYVPKLVGIGQGRADGWNPSGHEFLVKEWAAGEHQSESRDLKWYSQDRGVFLELMADAMVQVFERGYCLRDFKDIFVQKLSPQMAIPDVESIVNKGLSDPANWEAYKLASAEKAALTKRINERGWTTVLLDSLNVGSTPKLEEHTTEFYMPTMVDVGGFLPRPSKSNPPKYDKEAWMGSIGQVIDEFLNFAGLFPETRFEDNALLADLEKTRAREITEQKSGLAMTVNICGYTTPHRSLLVFKQLQRGSTANKYGEYKANQVVFPSNIEETIGDEELLQAFLKDFHLYTYHLQDQWNKKLL